MIIKLWGLLAKKEKNDMYFAQIFEKLLKIFGIIKLDEGKDKERKKGKTYIRKTKIDEQFYWTKPIYAITYWFTLKK